MSHDTRLICCRKLSSANLGGVTSIKVYVKHTLWSLMNNLVPDGGPERPDTILSLAGEAKTALFFRKLIRPFQFSLSVPAKLINFNFIYSNQINSLDWNLSYRKVVKQLNSSNSTLPPGHFSFDVLVGNSRSIFCRLSSSWSHDSEPVCTRNKQLNLSEYFYLITFLKLI